MTAFDSAEAPKDPIPLEHARSVQRRWLLGATATSAALVGVGAAWWQNQEPQVPTTSIPPGGFWTAQWDKPHGGTLNMQSFKGKPLLVNFWATWCAPCVEELPLINDFYRKNKGNGWQVLGLAVDKLAPVQSFLRNMPLDFPIGMAGLAGAEFGRGLGNLAGGLPFSVVLNGEGTLVQRKLGRLTSKDLDAWLRLK